MRGARWTPGAAALCAHTHAQLGCPRPGAGVPVLVEGERLRPGLDDLLAEADYVVTSANFPQVCVTGG